MGAPRVTPPEVREMRAVIIAEAAKQPANLKALKQKAVARYTDRHFGEKEAVAISKLFDKAMKLRALKQQIVRKRGQPLSLKDPKTLVLARMKLKMGKTTAGAEIKYLKDPPVGTMYIQAGGGRVRIPILFGANPFTRHVNRFDDVRGAAVEYAPLAYPDGKPVKHRGQQVMVKASDLPRVQMALQDPAAVVDTKVLDVAGVGDVIESNAKSRIGQAIKADWRGHQADYSGKTRVAVEITLKVFQGRVTKVKIDSLQVKSGGKPANHATVARLRGLIASRLAMASVSFPRAKLYDRPEMKITSIQWF